MPNTRDIRRRIKSVKSTSQITKAMELVAAAKMRRAQQQALATRTYAKLAWELVQNLSDKTDSRVHRLLRRPAKIKSMAIVLITSNRGLIGNFNNVVTNTALNLAKGDQAAEMIHFITLGKKGSLAAYRQGHTVVAQFEKKDAGVSALDILPLAKLLTGDFISGKYDKVSIVYMDFISTLAQKPAVRDLLPLSAKPAQHVAVHEWAEEGEQLPEELTQEYLFEPGADEVLEVLLPRLVEMQIYQALLETNAAEHSARMIAMKNATEAAGDLVDELTLEYNQVRQEAITTEISEIVAGQLALNH